MESVPTEKELKLAQEIQRLEKVTDGLGLEIEPGILETLAYLNLLGIPTNSSCEGHTEKERIAPPYIQGEAEDEPEYRYIGEREIVEDLLKKYGLSRMNDIFADDIVGGTAEDEYYRRIDEADETEEYKAWDTKNKPLRQAVENLISDFNSSRQDFKLKQTPIYPGYRIEADQTVYKDLAEDEKRKYVVRAQETFEAFKLFLKHRWSLEN